MSNFLSQHLPEFMMLTQASLSHDNCNTLPFSLLHHNFNATIIAIISRWAMFVNFSLISVGYLTWKNSFPQVPPAPCRHESVAKNISGVFASINQSIETPLYCSRNSSHALRSAWMPLSNLCTPFSGNHSR